MKSWTKSIVEDPDNPGELMLDLGNDVCAELGWQVGDTLEWIDNQNGTWTIKKKEPLTEHTK